MPSPLNIGGKTYARLPGRAKRLFGFFTNEKQRLYVGDDHLFVATTSYYYERYKRFYLADIQSLTIQKSAAGAVLNVVLGAIAGIFATIAAAGYAGQWDPAAQATLAVIAGFFLGTVLVNTAFGPTCQCHILTAVHEESLHCLGRLYTAQRVVEYLRAVIEGVQGAAGDMTDSTASASQRVERAADRREIASMLRKDSGRLHMALFSFLIFAALVSSAGLYYRSGISIVVYVAPSIVALGLALAAAIRQRDTDIPRSVRTVVWVALATNGLAAALHFYASIFEDAFGQGINPEAEQIAGVLRVGFAVTANALSAAANIVTGPAGLYSMRIWRRAAAVQDEQRRVAAEESGGT